MLKPQPGLFRATCYVSDELSNTGRHRFEVLVVKDRQSVVYRHESGVSFEILDQIEAEAGSYCGDPGVVRPVLKMDQRTDRVTL